MDIETDGGFWLVLGLMALLFPLRPLLFPLFRIDGHRMPPL